MVSTSDESILHKMVTVVIREVSFSLRIALGGQVGYVPDLHPSGLGSTPTWGNLSKQKPINH